MTKRRLRLLRTAHRARENARDRATATLATAEVSLARARADRRRAVGDYQAGATSEPGRIRGTSDLWKLRDQVDALRQRITEAERDVELAREAVADARARVSARERDVRMTERRLEHIRVELARREARIEQCEADDRAAVRRCG